MLKRIVSLATALALCVTLFALTAFAAAPTLAGTISGGKLTITASGLSSDVVQVEFLATNKDDSTDYKFDTAVAANGTATMVFTVTGSDYTINATTKGSDGSDLQSLTPAEATDIGVQYQAHVQSIGWQTPVENGAEAGTDGRALRVEALKINLTGHVPTGAKITYQAHVQTIGWQSPVSNGAEAGTDGKALRVEALKITLSGMTGYEVQYRAHVQKIGWQNWVTTTNGTSISSAALAGTTGQSLRVEAVEIRLVKVS